jgi:hypothetical protein
VILEAELALSGNGRRGKATEEAEALSSGI